MSGLGLVEAVAVRSGVAAFGPENPFYAASELPFGAPPYDRIKDEHYEPAMLAGLAQEAAEIRGIAANLAAPTFENTYVAMERSGALLNRVTAAFFGVAGAETNPVIEQLQTEMAPRWAAHDDAIYLDATLFERFDAVYERRGELGLAGEDLRLVEVLHDRFVRAGAKLSDGDKAKLKELNEEEAGLTNAFGRKLLAATKAGGYCTADKAALEGLSEAQLAAAGAAAEARGIEGYCLTLQNTTQQPALAYLRRRETRQALFEHSWNRCERGDENDTRETVAKLVKVRAEKGRLLGFSTYAAWKLQDQMAKTPETAIQFMDAMVPAAVAGARVEEGEIQALMQRDGLAGEVQPWDWDFYAEQVRKAKYDLDEDEVRPYFELNAVLERGVFYAAEKLYGITFQERYDLPVYQADVRVYEVFNGDGLHLAILYSDPFKRDNKRGGAWMSSFVRQSRLMGTQAVVTNVANIPKAAEGEPELIAFSDVITMFHEFGHALHGMFAEVEYPSLSGTAVPRDFVEFPSQFNEYWATHPEVFAHYARHYETGDAMPKGLAEKLTAAAKFNHGYERTELLAAAELDMVWHTVGAEDALGDLSEFERRALKGKGLAVAAVPPRYRSSYFAHTFGGGYAAGYYAYLWAEMLEEGAKRWFEEHGGLTRENGDRLRRMVLSRGNAEELAGMYERWVGGAMESAQGELAMADSEVR